MSTSLSAVHTPLTPQGSASDSLAVHRHEGSKPIDDGVILTEAEFDNMSTKNVERWVSAHIIPVSIHYFGRDRLGVACRTACSSQAPIDVRILN